MKLDLTADEAVIWLQMTEMVSMRDEAELVLQLVHDLVRKLVHDLALQHQLVLQRGP